MGGRLLIVLDTHVWIWSEDAPQRLGRDAARAIRVADRIGIPAISCYEVAVLAERGRIKLDRPVTEWIGEALARPRVELLPLTPGIAVWAARLGGTVSSDPVDRIIAATALEMKAPLVTKDERLHGLPQLEVVW